MNFLYPIYDDSFECSGDVDLPFLLFSGHTIRNIGKQKAVSECQKRRTFRKGKDNSKNHENSLSNSMHHMANLDFYGILHENE